MVSTGKKIPGLWFIDANGAIRIDHDDILYCHHKDGITKIVYSRDRVLKIHLSLGRLETKLNSNFYRCHRNYIINLAHAFPKCNIDDDVIRISSRYILPVSRRRKGRMLEMLKLIPLASEFYA
jgi:DNA-binding LytR/AlgR family response regulator